MRILETQVFKFSELTDAAKEKARDWWRQCEAQDNSWSEGVISDADQIATLMGIDIKRRTFKTMGGGTGSEPCIYWSGFWSQGDGASFEGTYSYTKGAAKAVRDYAPKDAELARIAAALQAAQRKCFYTLSASITTSGHYSHANTMRAECEAERGNADDVADDVIEALRDFANWIYGQLEKAYYWQNADAQVDENIECNEYEFTAEGKIV